MGSIPFWDPDEEGYSAPLYAPNPWDTMKIGGIQVPGIVEVTASAGLAYEKSKPSGSHGARITLTGKDPRPVEVKVYVCTPEQWDALQTLIGRVYSGDRKTAKAYDAEHPKLALYRIKALLVVDVAGPDTGRVAGERVVTLKCEEYSPVKKSGKSATQTPAAAVRDEFLQTPASANFTASDGTIVDATPATAPQSLPSDNQSALDP